MERPYDPVIPLLVIYLEYRKTLSLKNACTFMFVAVLLTITKTWNQPKCPKLDERIEKLRHRYSMEYYSAIKKQWDPNILYKVDKYGRLYDK